MSISLFMSLISNLSSVKCIQAVALIPTISSHHLSKKKKWKEESAIFSTLFLEHDLTGLSIIGCSVLIFMSHIISQSHSYNADVSFF